MVTRPNCLNVEKPSISRPKPISNRKGVLWHAKLPTVSEHANTLKRGFNRKRLALRWLRIAAKPHLRMKWMEWKSPQPLFHA